MGITLDGRLRVIPVPDARVTCGYGVRGRWWGGGRHRGIDFGAPIGAVVLAPWSGTVIGIGTWGPAFGARSPVLDFDRLPDGSAGLWGVLAHLDRCWVKVGEHVQAGQPVGTVGVRGNVTGPHLHFEVHAAARWSPWWLRRARDPGPWVRAQPPAGGRPPIVPSLPQPRAPRL